MKVYSHEISESEVAELEQWILAQRSGFVRWDLEQQVRKRLPGIQEVFQDIYAERLAGRLLQKLRKMGKVRLNVVRRWVVV